MNKNIENILKKVRHWTFVGPGLKKFSENYKMLTCLDALKQAAKDKRYCLTIYKDQDYAKISETLIGKILRLSRDFNNEYHLNAFDIRREIPEFPESEEEMKKLVKELGKPLSIYDAEYEFDLPAFLRKGKKVDDVNEILKSFFPEKYFRQYVFATYITPEKVTYRKIWKEIKPRLGILEWDLYKDGEKIYDINDVLGTIFKGKNGKQ